MFRKLISNLPYSPTLITEVGFYAKRLREEDVTRRVTVLFVVLTLIMQSLAVFSPPESANASSEQDIIRGGVSSLSDFLIRYDHNEDDIKDIFTTVGITRSEIVTAHQATITTANDTYILSRYGQLSANSSEISLTYQRSAGGVGVRYFSPLKSITDTSQSFSGWTGRSASLGWFGIVQSSGSLAVHGIPTSLSSQNTSSSGAIESITAQNTTQSSPSSRVTAQPFDKIIYTLTLSNPHSFSVAGNFSVRINDALEYSTLLDSGGGTVDQANGVLNWPTIELGPGQSQTRTIVVQLMSHIPATPVGTSNPESYDCKITVTFGSVSQTNVSCPVSKGLETALYQLPDIGAGGNVIFMSTLMLIVVFFAFRTRQLKKEIRIIRHNFNTGIV